MVVLNLKSVAKNENKPMNFFLEKLFESFAENGEYLSHDNYLNLCGFLAKSKSVVMYQVIVIGLVRSQSAHSHR